MAFNQHPIVEKLVTDPGAAPRLTVLNGYVGKAGKAGHVRIYTSPTLDSYVEVPEDGVKHVADPATPAAPNTVWLDSNAVVTTGSSAPQPEAASFLAGDITARYLSNALLNLPHPQPTPTAQPTHFGGVYPTTTALPTNLFGCAPTHVDYFHPTPTAQTTPVNLWRPMTDYGTPCRFHPTYSGLAAGCV